MMINLIDEKKDLRPTQKTGSRKDRNCFVSFGKRVTNQIRSGFINIFKPNQKKDSCRKGTEHQVTQLCLTEVIFSCRGSES